MGRGLGVAGALEGGAGGGGGGEGREGGGGGGAANAVPEVLLEDTLALLAQVSFSAYLYIICIILYMYMYVCVCIKKHICIYMYLRKNQIFFCVWSVTHIFFFKM